MLHVDALSRNMNVLTLEDNSFDCNLTLNQDADETSLSCVKKKKKSVGTKCEID